MIKGLSLIYSSLIHPLISNWLNNWLIIFISRRTIRGQCPNIIMYKGTVCPKINIYQKIRKRKYRWIFGKKTDKLCQFFPCLCCMKPRVIWNPNFYFYKNIVKTLLIQRCFHLHWLHNYYIKGMYYVINQ